MQSKNHQGEEPIRRTRQTRSSAVQNFQRMQEPQRGSAQRQARPQASQRQNANEPQAYDAYAAPAQGQQNVQDSYLQSAQGGYRQRAQRQQPLGQTPQHQVQGQAAYRQARPQAAQGQARQQAAQGQTQSQAGQYQAQPRDAASYDRDRYHARNSSVPAKGVSRAQAGASGASQRARGTRSSQYDSSPVQYRERRSGHSRKQSEPRSKMPFAVVGAVVALVLIVFGVSSCLKGGEDGASKDSGTAIEEQNDNTAAEETTSQDPNAAYLPTPYIVKSKGIKLHSAVAANQLTEILIHNASYDYACALSTKLTEATNTQVMAAKGTGRVADEQPTGDEWMTGEFIRCYRSGNAGPRMSAIDCGGPVGATVYAPVSGTVVKVKKYQLYNEYPDYQVHIQPEGRSDLDVVLIHLTDVSVKEGDTVVGGVTPIAAIRDVYAYIGDSMQLMYYTADGDNGNHTHIQVNNVNNKDYHGLD